MESSRLQEPHRNPDPSYIPKSKAAVVRNTCDKNFTGEHDPFIKTAINPLIPNSTQVRS